MTTIEKKDIELFTNYVNSFYNKDDGIYPIATSEEIDEAIQEYLDSLIDHEWMEWGYGDSLDRERVREILQPSYQIV